MKTFTDAEGQVWQVRISLHEIRLIRERLDLCLAPLYPDDLKPLPGDEDKPKKDQRSKYTEDCRRLDDEEPLIGAILLVICEEQAAKLGIRFSGDEADQAKALADFAGRFDLTSYIEARSAFAAELQLFSLSRRHKERVKPILELRQQKALTNLAAAQDELANTLANSPES